MEIKNEIKVENNLNKKGEIIYIKNNEIDNLKKENIEANNKNIQKVIEKPIFIKYQRIKKFKEDKNKNVPPKRNILKYQKKIIILSIL